MKLIATVRAFKQGYSVVVTVPKEAKQEVPGFEPGALIDVYIDEGKVIYVPRTEQATS